MKRVAQILAMICIAALGACTCQAHLGALEPLHAAAPFERSQAEFEPAKIAPNAGPFQRPAGKPLPQKPPAKDGEGEAAPTDYNPDCDAIKTPDDAKVCALRQIADELAALKTKLEALTKTEKKNPFTDALANILGGLLAALIGAAATHGFLTWQRHHDLKKDIQKIYDAARYLRKSLYLYRGDLLQRMKEEQSAEVYAAAIAAWSDDEDLEAEAEKEESKAAKRAFDYATDINVSRSNIQTFLETASPSMRLPNKVRSLGPGIMASRMACQNAIAMLGVVETTLGASGGIPKNTSVRLFWILKSPDETLAELAALIEGLPNGYRSSKPAQDNI